MLKVVGASWQKTRIGTYILIGAGLLVIGAFFIVYIDRPTYDGTYCATAFWTKQFGFQIEYWKQQNDLLNIPKGAARICYKDSIFENGWAQIEVETQRTYPDWVQAYGAGMLEGSLTWNNIYNQWENTILAACERDESSQKFCEWLRNLLMDNYARMKEAAIKRGASDHYWHQISLFYNQIEGLETGYMRGAKRARSDLEEEIPFSDFLLLNAAADIQDLRIYFENYLETNLIEPQNATDKDNEEFVTDGANKNFQLPSAIMLTKIFQSTNTSNWKLLFGHSTAGSYASMLRLQKRYKFHYHFTPDQRTNTVPGVDITFTGYPGILASTDDFYIVKGRQVQSIVAGVGIKYENLELWQTVNLQEGFMPLVARVMAANRIAQNRRTWAKAMARQSATGCKQWITVDLNKLNPQGNLFTTLSEDEKHDDAGLKLNAADEAAIIERQNRNKGLVWIAEQIPGRMHSKDVSEEFLLNGNSTWLARGVPYFDEILKASGVAPELREVQTESLHLNAATLTELQTLEAVDKYLRTHGFRGDLIGEQPVAYGNIDIKLFSYNAKEGMSDYHAFAGPIFMRTQQLPARTANKPAPPGSPTGLDEQNDISPSALQDGRLSIVIDDLDELSEYERINERRPVRNDMRAIALLRHESKPFKWSDVNTQIAHIEHNGQPDKWDFEHVYPSWCW